MSATQGYMVREGGNGTLYGRIHLPYGASDGDILAALQADGLVSFSATLATYSVQRSRGGAKALVHNRTGATVLVLTGEF